MKRIAVTINPQEWDTLITKYPASSRQVGLANFVSGTKNIDTDIKGNITKRAGGTTYSTLPTSAKDQYEAIFVDGAHHLLTVDNGNLRYSPGDGSETLVTGGYSTGANFEFVTTQDRVYFDNGVNTPQVYDRATSYGGVTYTAPRTKDMGAQTPVSAPTFAADTVGGAVPAGAHTYKVTFLYYGFEESNGGPASAVHTVVNPNNTVHLTAVPIGGYGVTARKIYRDNNDGNWTLLSTILDNTTTTYTDSLLIGATPTPIPINNNLPPTYGLITNWLTHLWVAKIPGSPYSLAYSDAGLPDIFPTAFLLTCNEQDPITAIIVYLGRLVVLNRHSFGQILGSTSNDFRYDSIESVIGCVDNRTVQIRVVQGVPLLIWLSERGFYSYDGNSIEYISDPIEDLVNFNIQQVSQQKGSNNQSTQAAFQAGTFSNGIDLITFPGEITTENPKKVWQSEADWEAGSSLTNIVTRDSTNTIKGIVEFAPLASNGTLGGSTLISGSTISLPLTVAFTGETSTQPPTNKTGSPFHLTKQIAVAIIPPRTGVFHTVTAGIQVTNNSVIVPDGGASAKVTIQTDTAGSPSGVVIGTGAILVGGVLDTFHTSTDLATSLTGGVKYWIVYDSLLFSNGFITSLRVALSTLTGGASRFFQSGSSTWIYDLSPTFDAAHPEIYTNYTFTYTPISDSGTWTSPIYDSASVNVSGTLNLITNAISFSIGNQDLTYFVDGSNDPLFSPFTVVAAYTNTSFPAPLSNFRYWRLRISLSTNDNVLTPSTSASILQFFTSNAVPAVWISEAIDATSDVTAFFLSTVGVTPAGCSFQLDVATSPDNAIYTAFVPFGTEVVQRYIKIRIQLFLNSDQTATPYFSNVTLTWTIIANLKSSAIDTTVSPPAGWDIFSANFQANGGTVLFEMRSATTALGLAGATFFTVTSGAFPPAGVVPLRFAQWRVTITSNADQVPEISGVTVNWFISSIGSIRPASIFTNGRYYLAVAKTGSSTNNIVIELDLKAKWRIYEDLTIATFSFFFNSVYYGSAVNGTINKWLTGLQDQGVNIPIDIRFKALDFSTAQGDNTEFMKTLDYIVLNGRGTGCTYQAWFSLDEGVTFTPLKYQDGATSVATTNNDAQFSIRLKSDKSDGNLIMNRNILIRLTTNDQFDISVQSIKVFAWLWEYEPFIPV